MITFTKLPAVVEFEKQNQITWYPTSSTAVAVRFSGSSSSTKIECISGSYTSSLTSSKDTVLIYAGLSTSLAGALTRLASMAVYMISNSLPPVAFKKNGKTHIKKIYQKVGTVTIKSTVEVEVLYCANTISF